MQRHWLVTLAVWLFVALAAATSTVTGQPQGTLTVAVATFGNERWLPHLYVGAEDIVLKPVWENLLSRDPKTGDMIPLLAERWEVLDGGRTWRFYLRKGVRFHNGQELTAEDVQFTFASIVKEGSANAIAPWFRPIKSMEIEDPYTIVIRFEKPLVNFANKVTQGLFGSTAFIHSKKHIESMGEEGADRHPVGTGPWKFVEHVRGDRLVYEAVENHWRTVPHFKRLVFLKVPEPATRMAMLRAGSVDVIEIGGEYVEELQKPGCARSLCPTWPGCGSFWVGNGPARPLMMPLCPGPYPMPNAPARCAWRSTWRWISRPLCSRYWGAWERRRAR